MAMLPIIALLAWRRRLPGDLGELAGFCMVALLSNAVVCGALSNPHDRYGARIVWLAAFTARLALVRLYERRQAAPAEAAARDILPA